MLETHQSGSEYTKLINEFTTMTSSYQGDTLNQPTREGEFHGDDGSTTEIPITRSTYIFVLCAALNSCNLGFDIGVSTTAGRLVEEDWDLSRIEREVFIGSINFWALFGALLAQYFTDGYGRRNTFMLAAAGFILGVLIMAFAPNYQFLMFGRIFVGLGVGVGLAIDPLYIAEISPAKHRGKLVTYSEIALNLGIVMGFSTGLLFSGMAISTQWRTMFLCGGIMPFVMIFLVLNVMPESPRWLVSKDRSDEARVVLQQIYPEGYNVDVLISEIKESLTRDQKAEHAVGWGVIAHPSPGFRRMLLVGVGMAISQQAIGIDAIQYYLLDLIAEAGIDSDAKRSIVLIVLGLIKMYFVVLGGNMFDRYGRRRLIFISLLGCAASLLLISLFFLIDSTLSTVIIVTSLAVYLGFFSVGMGPGAWLIPAEVFSLSIRGKAMSIATMANRITATLVSSTFLSTVHVLGLSGFFFMLCVVCLLVFGFMYIVLPETKGRSLEDMSIYFAEITGDQAVLEAEALVRQQVQTSAAYGTEQSQSTKPTGSESEII